MVNQRRYQWLLLRKRRPIPSCFCVAIVLVDGFNTIIVARRTEHVFRLARFFYSVTWAMCASLARRIPSGRRRESFLAIYGPLSVLVLLTLWEVALMAGFGFIQWGAGMRAEARALLQS